MSNYNFKLTLKSGEVIDNVSPEEIFKCVNDSLARLDTKDDWIKRALPFLIQLHKLFFSDLYPEEYKTLTQLLKDASTV